MLHPRLGRLPARQLAPHATVLEARGFRSRLLGLALVRRSQLPDRHALLLSPCSSVHTFGMRFAIDVAFAAADGEVLRVIRDVRPRRVTRCQGAAVALEAPAGELSRFLTGGRGAGSRLAPGVLAEPS